MPAPLPTRKFLVNLVGVLCLVTAPLWLYLLLFPEGYAYTAGIFVFLAVLVADSGMLMHVSRQDPELRHIMIVGLFVKFMGAAAYVTMMLHYYQGAGDVFAY